MKTEHLTARDLPFTSLSWKYIGVSGSKHDIPAYIMSVRFQISVENYLIDLFFEVRQRSG